MAMFQRGALQNNISAMVISANECYPNDKFNNSKKFGNF